jgi:hypothetical protein
MTWARRCAVAASVAVALLGTTGCSAPNDPTRGWDEPRDYSVTVRYQAYDIDAGTYRVIVRDHEVASFVRIDHRGVVPDEGRGPDADYFTLRQIVGRFQTALADRDSRERIAFGDDGMPTEVTIDWQPLRITDEQAWFITDIDVKTP